MKVFVEFVGSVFFVDLKLSQNPYMPTTLIYHDTYLEGSVYLDIFFCGIRSCTRRLSLPDLRNRLNADACRQRLRL